MKTIYGVYDQSLNPRSKWGELCIIITCENNRNKKFIDTERPYYYTYYFSTEQKAIEFENKLWGERNETE